MIVRLPEGKVRKLQNFLVAASSVEFKIIDAETGNLIETKEPLVTKSYSIERDHWLWLHRISMGKPKANPDWYNPKDPHPFQLGRMSAKKMYEACGIKNETGETILYSARTSVFIARLTTRNHQSFVKINQTVYDWRQGKFDQWHHDEVRKAPNSTDR